MPAFPPTPEQQAICEHIAGPANGPLIVPAYAGCAKTTTIELAAPLAPERQALAVAFNKTIATELQRRLPGHFEVKTLNGLGHGAFARAVGRRLELDDRKIGKLVTQVSKDAGLELTQDEWQECRQLVSRAQSQGLVPSGIPQRSISLLPDEPETWGVLCEELWINPTESLIQLARRVLTASIELAFKGIITFDDQIYMSALFGGQFPRFPLVFVDEAQDLSPLNHIQIRKVSSGRLCVVGDPKQAIYAFRGADSESMTKLRSLRAEWATLPLTTTFRCPRAIVARQQHHAPGFNAAPSAPKGVICDWKWSQEARSSAPTLLGWSWPQVQSLASDLGPRATIAVLCRNNAPLLRMAFKLIRQGTGVQMLGRDIGRNLVALSRKILPDDSTPQIQSLSLLTDWTESERAKLLATGGSESKLDALGDRAECLLAVLEAPGVSTAGDLRKALERLFQAEGSVTLSTGHRVKGLEYDLVLHLDPWRVPSRQARRQAAEGHTAALQQELNLLYVMETRAKHTLIQADLETFMGAES